MEQINYKEIFKTFEPKLIREIKRIQTMKLPKGAGGQEGMAVEFIPLMLRGSIKVYKEDDQGRESTIYDLHPGESCILSITAAYEGAKANTASRALEDSIFIGIPPKKSNEWFVKYASWRKFVIDLYDSRLQELIIQHQKVTKQRDDISNKNHQIMESIRYAQRIQSAILPPEELIHRYISEHFVYYRPKDIVSGDFYWLRHEKDRVMLAAADATGHGVPGAFMSMLGISLMNEISQGFSGTAANFLNILRTKVKDSLRQSEYDSSPKDGMDVSLCILYPETGKLEFAGAYNPLLCVRNSKLIEFKADKMPIGIHYVEKDSFTNQVIEVSKDDMFYMFSDGFPDQNGGKNNRKYMRKNFRVFLESISNLDVEEQKNKIHEEFLNWKAEHEQVDDILVFGFRIKKAGAV